MKWWDSFIDAMKSMRRDRAPGERKKVEMQFGWKWFEKYIHGFGMCIIQPFWVVCGECDAETEVDEIPLLGYCWIPEYEIAPGSWRHRWMPGEFRLYLLLWEFIFLLPLKHVEVPPANTGGEGH